MTKEAQVWRNGLGANVVCVCVCETGTEEVRESLERKRVGAMG